MSCQKAQRVVGDAASDSHQSRPDRISTSYEAIRDGITQCVACGSIRRDFIIEKKTVGGVNYGDHEGDEPCGRR
jgi:hypothetical protein